MLFPTVFSVGNSIISAIRTIKGCTDNDDMDTVTDNDDMDTVTDNDVMDTVYKDVQNRLEIESILKQYDVDMETEAQDIVKFSQLILDMVEENPGVDDLEMVLNLLLSLLLNHPQE